MRGIEEKIDSLPEKYLGSIPHIKNACISSFLVLWKFTQLTFFVMIFPIEVINYINKFYFLCITKNIADNIYVFNVCICEDKRCIDNWYNNMELTDVKKEWSKYHCSMEGCHTIYDQTDDSVWFRCHRCQKEYCNDCFSESDALPECEYYSYCNNCIDIIEKEHQIIF
jgi:hypothetical protein